jgi:hypothetical protein
MIFEAEGCTLLVTAIYISHQIKFYALPRQPCLYNSLYKTSNVCPFKHQYRLFIMTRLEDYEKQLKDWQSRLESARKTHEILMASGCRTGEELTETVFDIEMLSEDVEVLKQLISKQKNTL